MPTENLALIFQEVPTGLPEAGKHLVVKNIGYDHDEPLPPNSVSLRIKYLSYDPYLRGRLRPAYVPSYFPALTLGEPLVNGGLGEVLKSTTEGLTEGDIVSGILPFQQFATITIGTPGFAGPIVLNKIPVQLGPQDIRHWLGALGLAGLTAYSSLYEIAKPKKGETIFVTSAAGAVGQVVAAIAKHEGLHVIGSAGSDEKVKFLTKDLSYDAGFNYKTEKATEALARLAPEGIDIYYDNVGGEQLDAALTAMKLRGRIVVSGQVSQYNSTPEQEYGVKNLMQVVGKRLTMRGFVASDDDFMPKYYTECVTTVGKWLQDGTLKANIAETPSIKQAAEGLIGMLKGENFGKAVLKV